MVQMSVTVMCLAMEAYKSQNSEGGKHYLLLVELWPQEDGAKPNCLFFLSLGPPTK